MFDPRLLVTLEGYYSAAIVARSYMSEEKFDGFGTGNIYTRKRKPNSAALDFSKSNPRQEMFMGHARPYERLVVGRRIIGC